MSVSVYQFHMPRYAEIPTVGLYLEQTVLYLNRALEPLGCPEMTPSMVSNYVKKGYIGKPMKKQYNEEQIARLFFLAVAKQVLAMDEIAALFAIQVEQYTPERAYDYFCRELEQMLAFLFGYGEEPAVIGEDMPPAKKMLRSVIIAVSHIIFLRHSLELAGHPAQQ